MKVVIDTNILIASIFWNGSPYEILQMALDGTVSIFISDETVREVRKVLKEEFKLTEQETDDILQAIMICCKIIIPDKILPVVLRDPKDDHVVACAISADVKMIVTRDKDLLDLKWHRDIRIITPEEFIPSVR